jgi:hypothetical protein
VAPAVYRARQEGAHVFELRDGKVIRLEIYASRQRALQYVQAAEAERART